MADTNKCCRSNFDDKSCKDYIRGINCDVKSCYFNDNCDHCTAERIEVGPSYAATSNDTACATFKPKKD